MRGKTLQIVADVTAEVTDQHGRFTLRWQIAQDFRYPMVGHWGEMR
jgi:glycerate kinase